MRNKKALSAIVSVVIIIGLTIAAGAIVFTVVRNLASDKLNDAQSCLKSIEKFEINGAYTCYNSTGQEIQISISRKELGIDYLMIVISSGEESRTFKLYDEAQVIEGVVNYPSRTTSIVLPGNESGKTYIIDWNLGIPEKIQITPSINKKICNIVDEINTIQSCI